MLEKIEIRIGGLRGPLNRYALLDRVAACAAKQGVTWLAFGIHGENLRLVVDGAPRGLGLLVRGVKVGTVRAAIGTGEDLAGYPGDRIPVADLEEAVVWAHTPSKAGTDPLAEVYTSHRELLRFRRSRWADAAALCSRVDARRVHDRLGGQQLPAGWPPAASIHEDLDLLLRLAAAVIGTLPADRRCFRLFAHLAKARGWQTAIVAEALALTDRRVRQLLAEVEPLRDLGLICLGDTRLRTVP